MVCKGYDTITHQQLESFVAREADKASTLTETVDAFRTMSWVHRSDEETLGFRHEALTVVCAAEHICEAFERRDSISLAEWQNAAPLAPVVCDCVAEIIDKLRIISCNLNAG